MRAEVQMEPIGGESHSADLLLQNQDDSCSSSSSSSPASAGENTNRDDDDDDDDLENGSAPTCRICLESDCEPGDDLISPCKCKGTQQFVHRVCLDHWRAVKEGFAFSRCTTCKAQFHLRVAKHSFSSSWRKIKFRLSVIRDVLVLFLAAQTVIAAMGGAYFLMDKVGFLRDADWDRIVSKHPIPIYYSMGVSSFFILLGFFFLILRCSTPNRSDARMAIQKIWQRRYDILAKRELTKEYIVEDLHGCSYTPPKLDAEHEEKLKMLMLL